MELFITFVRKEFYHISRDYWTMVILLLLPLIMLILFGFMMSTEVKNTHFVIYDPSHDAATQGITNKISMSEYFTFSGYIDNPNQTDDVFKSGKIGLVIVFGNQFYNNLLHTGEAQIQLIADGSDPNTASTLVMYASNLILSYQQDLLKEAKIPLQIKPEIRFLYNPTLKGSYNFVPGVMGMILMLICAMMTSVSIAREKEMGTMEVLLVSPMQPIQIILSKVVPYFAISIINLTTILLMSVFVLDVPINGSLGLLIIISLIFIFVSLALGLLISSAVDKQMVALLISALVLMLPVMMLSGLMFPIENQPIYIQPISQIIPAKWYMEAVKKIMIQGLGFNAVIKEITVLTSMAIFLIFISIKRFKTRLS